MMGSLANRARELALMMTRWPSVTGSTAEASFPQHVTPHLKIEKVWTEPLPHDPANRSNVFALKRGTSQRTVVLTGHFDVVSVEDYGALQPLAFDPEQLLPWGTRARPAVSCLAPKRRFLRCAA